MRARMILEISNLYDMIIIRNYITDDEICRDLVKNLLDKKNYNMDYEVLRIEVVNGIMNLYIIE